MESINITLARYNVDTNGNNCSISIVLEGDSPTTKRCVPLAPGNRHYDEIMRQVAAGTLTIQDAD